MSDTVLKLGLVCGLIAAILNLVLVATVWLSQRKFAFMNVVIAVLCFFSASVLKKKLDAKKASRT